MSDSFVAVLDSGIGGISLLKPLADALPEKRFLYFGDNSNAPYGNKTKEELFELTVKNIDYIKRYNIEAIVLGCNTLSVNLLDEIKDYSNLPVFGVFPPVDIAKSFGGRVLLLATCSTAKRFAGETGIDVVGFKDLADDIEKNALFLKKVDLTAHLNSASGQFVDQKGYYDTLILGCTHYFFIKNKIFDHFCPQKIISGNDFTVKEVSKILSSGKTQVNHYRNNILFVGKNAKNNENFFVLSGQ